MKRIFRYLLVLPPALLCLAAVALCHRADAPAMLTVPAATEEERSAFLFSKGWQGELIASQAVRIPQSMDGAYANYAALQTYQHLPLADYAGERAVLYTYALQDSVCRAELLTADGILIGAQCYVPEDGAVLDMRGSAAWEQFAALN